jgi:hypothetical protein
MKHIPERAAAEWAAHYIRAAAAHSEWADRAAETAGRAALMRRHKAAAFSAQTAGKHKERIYDLIGLFQAEELKEAERAELAEQAARLPLLLERADRAAAAALAAAEWAAAVAALAEWADLDRAAWQQKGLIRLLETGQKEAAEKAEEAAGRAERAAIYYHAIRAEKAADQ